VSNGMFNPATAGVGTHVITYTYADSNGCSNTAIRNIEVVAAPQASVSAAGPTTFCAGGGVWLIATPSDATQYEWLRDGMLLANSTDDSLFVTDTGSYRVVVSGTACSASSASIQVTVDSLPSTTITPVGSTVICSGDVVVLNAPTAS